MGFRSWLGVPTAPREAECAARVAGGENSEQHKKKSRNADHGQQLYFMNTSRFILRGANLAALGGIPQRTARTRGARLQRPSRGAAGACVGGMGDCASCEMRTANSVRSA